MRITPLDIRKQEFRKTMRGLDSDEVYAFLSTVAEEYEAVLSDNKGLRERIVALEESLQEYKKIESNLRNTLLTAEQVTKEARENARKEANLIVREAEVEAEKAAEAIRAHTQQLRREILELKRQKDNYLTRFKTLIESHRRVIGGFEEDFAEVDREIERIGKQVEEDVHKSVPAPRISRETITEEFGHAPKDHDPEDKVTWGEEPKREDAPRPSVPRPDWKAKEDAKPGGVPPENIEAQSPRDEAKTVFEPTAEQTEMLHLDAQPLGADIGEPQHPDEIAAMEEGVHDTSTHEGELSKENHEVRHTIAQGIEEKFYPEIHFSGGAGDPKSPPKGQVVPGAPQESGPARGQPAPGAPQKSAAPQAQAPSSAPHGPEAPQGQAGTVTAAIPRAEMPQTEMTQDEAEPTPQDHWKGYEIREKKPDWSTYEISPENGAGAVSASSDNELDEALSGLKEIPREPEQKMGDHGETPHEHRAEVADGTEPKRGACEPARTAGPVPEQKQEAKTDETSKKTDAAKGDDATWSLEELRRNLTNIKNEEQ